MAGCCCCGSAGSALRYGALALPLTFAGIELYKSEVGSTASFIWMGAIAVLALLGVGMIVVARRSAMGCAPKGDASPETPDGVDADGRHIRGSRW